MNKRLEAILEAITNIVEGELVTGEEARRLAAAKKRKGRLPSKKKIKQMERKAEQEKEIEELEKAN